MNNQQLWAEAQNQRAQARTEIDRQVSTSLSSVRLTPDEIMNEMSLRAMKKAVELGVFPKHVDQETYLKTWSAMREILSAALHGDSR